MKGLDGPVANTTESVGYCVQWFNWQHCGYDEFLAGKGLVKKARTRLG